MTLPAHVAVTPAGSPVAAPMPVAPVVAIVILVNAVLIQSVGLDDGAPAVLAAVTVMVPVAVAAPQPPVSGVVSLNVPAAVGVVVLVILFAAPIPVAPVVAIVIFVNALLIPSVGLEDGAPAVLAAVTVMVPVAVAAPQPPVSGIV